MKACFFPSQFFLKDAFFYRPLENIIKEKFFLELLFSEKHH